MKSSVESWSNHPRGGGDEYPETLRLGGVALEAVEFALDVVQSRPSILHRDYPTIAQSHRIQRASPRDRL